MHPTYAETPEGRIGEIAQFCSEARSELKLVQEGSPSLGGYGGRSHILAERQPCQLGARGQSELREDASQVRIDCARREEQHRCNFLVREAFSDETGNLKLLRRQLFNGTRVALPRRLSGGPELGRRALSPGCGAKAPECLESGPKMQARVHTMALAPEVLAVEEMDPSEIERPRVVRELERLLVRRRCIVAMGDERATASQSRARPGSASM